MTGNPNNIRWAPLHTTAKEYSMQHRVDKDGRPRIAGDPIYWLSIFRFNKRKSMFHFNKRSPILAPQLELHLGWLWGLKNALTKDYQVWFPIMCAHHIGSTFLICAIWRETEQIRFRQRYPWMAMMVYLALFQGSSHSLRNRNAWLTRCYRNNWAGNRNVSKFKISLDFSLLYVVLKITLENLRPRGGGGVPQCWRTFSMSVTASFLE